MIELELATWLIDFTVRWFISTFGYYIVAIFLVVGMLHFFGRRLFKRK